MLIYTEYLTWFSWWTSITDCSWGRYRSRGQWNNIKVKDYYSRYSPGYW